MGDDLEFVHLYASFGLLLSMGSPASEIFALVLVAIAYVRAIYNAREAPKIESVS